MGSTYKTINYYWTLFVTTFDAIFLWGWISVVDNMRIDVTVLLLYPWLCLIKSPVKNRTSHLHRIKAEWVRMKSTCEWVICAQQTWVAATWESASVVCGCSRFCYVCIRGSRTWPILWRRSRAPVQNHTSVASSCYTCWTSEALTHEFHQTDI
jgi:hypothetical protein